MPQRPFFIAALLQGAPSRLRAAPQRGRTLALMALAFCLAVLRNRAERRHGSRQDIFPRLPNGAPFRICAVEVSRKKRLDARSGPCPFSYATGCFTERRSGVAEKAACALMKQ
jgi:hypothetical protein